MADLEGALAAAAPAEGGESYGELQTNQRQEEAVRTAREAGQRAKEALMLGVTPDALLTDVEQALSSLGELTGQAIRAEITDRIFAKFCVGK